MIWVGTKQMASTLSFLWVISYKGNLPEKCKHLFIVWSTRDLNFYHINESFGRYLHLSMTYKKKHIEHSDM